jgi:hypothetical protein
VIQPETITGRKEYFRKKREAFVSTWTTDANGIVHISFKNGLKALFSAHHLPLVSKFLWRPHPSHSKAKPKWYAEAKVPEELREVYGRHTSLHRVILGVGAKIEIDHKDGNGLNCVDSNIRIATRSQNASNRRYENSNGFRGVIRRPRCTIHPFSAQIRHLGKNYIFGSYTTEIEAAIRYNTEALRVFGEFAILNEIPGWEPESNSIPGGNGMNCVL